MSCGALIHNSTIMEASIIWALSSKQLFQFHVILQTAFQGTHKTSPHWMHQVWAAHGANLLSPHCSTNSYVAAAVLLATTTLARSPLRARPCLRRRSRSKATFIDPNYYTSGQVEIRSRSLWAYAFSPDSDYIWTVAWHGNGLQNLELWIPSLMGPLTLSLEPNLWSALLLIWHISQPKWSPGLPSTQWGMAPVAASVIFGGLCLRTIVPACAPVSANLQAMRCAVLIGDPNVRAAAHSRDSLCWLNVLEQTLLEHLQEAYCRLPCRRGECESLDWVARLCLPASSDWCHWAMPFQNNKPFLHEVHLRQQKREVHEGYWYRSSTQQWAYFRWSNGCISYKQGPYLPCPKVQEG